MAAAKKNSVTEFMHAKANEADNDWTADDNDNWDPEEDKRFVPELATLRSVSSRWETSSADLLSGPRPSIPDFDAPGSHAAGTLWKSALL